MSWTKRDLIKEAYTELGLAPYEFDLEPEEMQVALRRLDTMMATWDALGVRVGYLLPANPGDSDLDQESGLPDMAVETVYLNLAKRIAPGKGKQMQPLSLKNAREGYDRLLWGAAYPQLQQLPSTMPRGAGNKPWRYCNGEFMPRPDFPPLTTTEGGDLEIVP